MQKMKHDFNPGLALSKTLGWLSNVHPELLVFYEYITVMHISTS